MNIPITLEIDKTLEEGFEEFVGEVLQKVLKAGQQVVASAMEAYDKELAKSRDKGRYRDKGLRKNCIKTKLGEIEYKRHVYLDNACAEMAKCTYLLDDMLQITSVGKYGKDLCLLAANAITGSTYRDAAAAITEMTGSRISHQGLWNIVQKLGAYRGNVIDRHVALMEMEHCLGKLQTKILYDENDGLWLKMQGNDRENYPHGREMKLGICYDGVTWTRVGANGKRRKLDQKIAYAGFMDARTFRQKKAALTYSRFDPDSIEMIVKNGDGAGWVQCVPEKEKKTITVLDEFHRNKKLKECVLDPNFAKTLQTLLYEGKAEEVIEVLQAQITTLEVEPEKTDETERLKELLRYYRENEEGLIGIYERGLHIPETRKPGEIHHAQLGSMESNVFTLAGNRMKGRRRCWSVRGANNLVSLLCMKYTVGFEQLFDAIPELPKPEPEEEPDYNILLSSKVKTTEGKGYEYPRRGCISDEYRELKAIRNLLS